MKQLLFLLISLSCFIGAGQTTSTVKEKRALYTVFQLKYHVNRFPRNHSVLDDFLTKTNANAIEARIGITTYGKKQWHKRWKYPTYGIAILQTTWGGSKYLGNPGAVYLFFNTPLLNSKKKVSLNYDVGLGLGYGTKRYDSITNPTNDLIGSSLNMLINFRVELNYDFSNRLSADLGAGWTHYSNGRVRTPNIGINMVGVNVGLRYHFRPSDKALYEGDNYKPKQLNPVTPEFVPFGEYSAVVTGGWRESSNHVDSKTIYGVGSFTIEANRHYGTIGKYGIGFDLFYDGGLAEEYPDGVSAKKFLYKGIHIGHEFKINKFAFITQIGAYLQKTPEKGFVYTRFALRYNVTKNINVRCGLKTLNGFAADFAEAGVGFSVYGKNYSQQDN